MTQRALNLPFEFLVFGKPVKARSKDENALRLWELAVFQSAKLAVGNRSPTTKPVKLLLTHYYDSHLDNPTPDSIAKQVSVILVGIAWADRKCFDDYQAIARDLNGSFRVRNLSPVLATGFIKGTEFIHVVVENAGYPRVL